MRKEGAKIKANQKNNPAEGNLNSEGLKTGGKPLKRVGDVMTRHVITMSPHHSFSDAITLMEKHSFNILWLAVVSLQARYPTDGNIESQCSE
jgi:hypothetical protein